MSKETIIRLTSVSAELDARSLQGIHQDQGFLMCHPHPLFGGTMDNKVVTTCVRAAAGIGLSTMRFNFRGVGDSTGTHDDGIQEQEDVLTAIRYARDILGWTTLYLGGFSFGSGMACLSSLKHPEMIDGLFMIAPAVHHFDAPNSLSHDWETHVYMGDADEVVPFRDVMDWTDRVTPQPHVRVFEQATHFFHGRLLDLKAALREDLIRLQPQLG